MNFLKILYGVGESDMIQLVGTDFTLFTKYLKYNAMMFAVMTILNFAILLPVYLTGSPKEVIGHFS